MKEAEESEAKAEEEEESARQWCRHSTRGQTSNDDNCSYIVRDPCIERAMDTAGTLDSIITL